MSSVTQWFTRAPGSVIASHARALPRAVRWLVALATNDRTHRKRGLVTSVTHGPRIAELTVDGQDRCVRNMRNARYTAAPRKCSKSHKRKRQDETELPKLTRRRFMLERYSRHLVK